jgi:hypothetical protein
MKIRFLFLYFLMLFVFCGSTLNIILAFAISAGL